MVRFFTVSIITGHLHRKVVFWETVRQLSDTSGKLENQWKQVRKSNATMCIGHGHGTHSLGSPLFPYLHAAGSESTGYQGGQASACLMLPLLPHRETLSPGK